MLAGVTGLADAAAGILPMLARHCRAVGAFRVVTVSSTFIRSLLSRTCTVHYLDPSTNISSLFHTFYNACTTATAGQSRNVLREFPQGLGLGRI